MKSWKLSFRWFSFLSLAFIFQVGAQAQELTSLTPTKDAYVQQGRGNKGRVSNLPVKNRGEAHTTTRNAWVGFDISQFSNSGQTVEKAEFRLFLGKLTSSETTHTIFEGDNNWEETTLQYVSPTSPEVFPWPLAQKTLTKNDVNSWVVYDVTDYVNILISSGQTEVTFVIEAEDSAYSHYDSRETANVPTLNMTAGESARQDEVADEELLDEVLDDLSDEEVLVEEPVVVDLPVAEETQAEQESPDGQIRVNDVTSLQAALDNATAGDVIVVAPGVYAPSGSLVEEFAGGNRRAYFRADASGSENAPIVLKAEDPTNPPVIRGLHVRNSDYLLWIRGDHWIVEDLILEQGGKGLMLDGSSNSVISRLVVFNIGEEGIHLRSGTSSTVVEDCKISDTGMTRPGLGEGIYIGSDGRHWSSFDRSCDNNVIRRCEVRTCTAECIDIKEGTRNSIVEDCLFYGARISGENFADSFIDLKGVGAHVRNNRFYKQSNETVTRGVAIVHRSRGTTAEDNLIYGNQFFMNNSNGLMVHAYRGDDNFAWDNTRIPAGQDYQGDSPELRITPPN